MTAVQTILLSLNRNTSPKSLVDKLKDNGINPLIVAKPVEWIIQPSVATYLLTHDWDLLLVLEPGVELPQSVQGLIDAAYTVRVKQPERALEGFRERNEKLLKQDEGGDPPLSSLPKKPLRSLSSQRLELTPSLMALANSDLCPKGPVSMLNFVAFQPWPEAGEKYKKYVNVNKAGPQKKVGSSVKFIGPVDNGAGEKGRGEWDEVILAQYPSLRHFCDMACDPDYQEGNYKWRLPSLRDTCILMTTEVQLDWTIQDSEKVRPEDNRKTVFIDPSA